MKVKTKSFYKALIDTDTGATCKLYVKHEYYEWSDHEWRKISYQTWLRLANKGFQTVKEELCLKKSFIDHIDFQHLFASFANIERRET